MEEETFPLGDATDADILMHRDAHFGGSFSAMLEYYEKGGKGIDPSFEIKRIQELQAIEEGTKQNLAALLLGGADAERIARAKDAYKQFRDLYDIQNPTSPYPQLIADLILSEEEHPQKEIDAIVEKKIKIIPALMDLIHSQDFRDPLFPGYGQAPALAAECLGRIGDKRGIMTLFEMIGEGDFFEDEGVINALYAIGKPAEDFLLRIVQSKPVTEDNERAAIALIHFKEDPEVAKACFHVLKTLDMKKDPVLASYLILACEGLQKNSPEMKEFVELAKNCPKELNQDFKTIIATFKL